MNTNAWTIPMTKPLTLQYANMCPIMINDHPSVACQFGKLFRFRHTHGLAEGCRSLLKLLSLWQIRTKISFPANDITQFIIVWGCAWILIEKTLNGPAYGNTCRCSESILCCPVITLLKRWVCETTNCGWTIMEPGSKPSPKTKPLIERLLMARRVHAESEFSMKEAGGSLIYFSPSSVVLLSRFRVCFCVRMWHGARIDLWRFPASDISNRSSAPWLSWVNILASGEVQRGWCQLKSLVAIT